MTMPSDPQEIIMRDHCVGGKPALGAFLPVEQRMANAERIERSARQATGTDLLDKLADTIGRYVAFPSEAARVAVTLWAAHAHAIDQFESTPRLALLSPEKGSGKTRTLEVVEMLVPKPMHAVNCTAAALFRSVGDSDRATVLFDEADTYFGPRSAKDHEELRGLVNAGHRRGAVAYRCVGQKQEVRVFPAYAAVALAGIGDLPDTIIDRAVVISMRRRAPGEQITPFRLRQASPILHALRDQLAGWIKTVADDLAAATPTMPDGITDRPADVWEPLLSIADAAGGEWPARARAACVELNAARHAADPSLGVRLLGDLAVVFKVADRLHTEDILHVLTKMDEAPWGDLRGKPLDARGLARRLRRFEVRPVDVRIGDAVKKGYHRGDLVDAWARYLPPEISATSATAATTAGQSTSPDVALNGRVADASATSPLRATGNEAVTSTCSAVADVALPGESAEEGHCAGCDKPLQIPNAVVCWDCQMEEL